MTQCARCPSSIRFVRMRGSGRPMPIDPWPDERGNVAALKTANGYVDGRYLAAGEQLAEGEVRLMPHFATCSAPDRPGHPKQAAPPPVEPQPTLLDL